MSSIAVAHIVTGLQIGGLERVVLNLARGFDRRRWRIMVVCLHDSGPFSAELEQLGVNVIALGGQPGMSWRLARRLVDVLRQENVDIIHTHNPAPHFHGILAALLAGVSVRVHTKHGRNYPDDRKKVLLNRVLSWFTDVIVPVSDNAAEVALKIEKVNPRKVRRIWNGVDVALYAPRGKRQEESSKSTSPLAPCPLPLPPCPLPLPLCPLPLSPSAPVIGTVARLSPEKDQKTMLAAFKIVLEEWERGKRQGASATVGTAGPAVRLGNINDSGALGEHALPHSDQSPVSGLRSQVSTKRPRLVVIGDGPCLSELQNEANRLGIAGQVDFLGMRSDIPSLLPHFSLFTLSSVTEGISMTILEAMACGVPVVATDVGGNREIVQPPACGLIVPARDPQALAAAYLELLRNPARRAQMGAAARQRVVEHFSLETMCRQYAELYEELLQRSSNPSSLRSLCLCGKINKPTTHE